MAQRRQNVSGGGGGAEMKRRASLAPGESGKKLVIKDDPKNMGFLYTGHLDKRNPITGSFKQRFVVLTHDAIHWFKRSESETLFGEERGQIALTNIRTTRIPDEDSTVCEIVATTNKKTLFRADSPQHCEEWVSAIRSAVKKAQLAAAPTSIMQRRSSVSGILGLDFEEGEHDVKEGGTPEVTIALVSFLSAGQSAQQVEIVIARNPEFGRLISIPKVHVGDQVIISTSNGGTVPLTYEMMVRYCEEDVDFESTVKDVPLASSVKMTLIKETKVASNPAEAYAEEARRQGRALSRFDRVLQIVIVLTSERNSAISLILSMMVIMAGIGSFRYIGGDTSMLFFMAALLSLYNLNQVFKNVDAANTLGGAKGGLTLQLTVVSHSFTSPDAPVVNDAEDEIPTTFINGCEGDMKEARRRWDITRHWRETEGVNNILNEPQPNYFLIKQMYPHYCCCRAKDGSIIYNERVCELEQAQLAARGCGLDEFFRHWLFCSEYQWNVICKENSDIAKGVTIQDIKGITLGFVSGDNLTFLKKTIAIAGAHYPERSHAILVVNAPWISSALWKMLSPLVHENTRKKVRILSEKETLAGLQEFIDEENIPIYYGGKLDYGGPHGLDTCRFNSPEQLAMDQYVRELNERHGIGMDGKPLVDDGSAAVETNGEVSTRHANESPNQGAEAEGGTGTGTGRGSGAGLRLSTDARRDVRTSEVPITPTPNTTRSSTAGTDWSASSNTTMGSGTPANRDTSLTSPIGRQTSGNSYRR